MKNSVRMSEAEMEVMRTIWGLDSPVTVAQLLDIFKDSKCWKTSTISTILARLMEKKFLTKSMVGKVNFYTPALTLDEYRKRETKAFLNNVHNGSVKNFISALVDDANITQSEIVELKEWFNGKAGEI